MESELQVKESNFPVAQGIKWGIILMVLSTLLFHLIFWNVDFSDTTSYGEAVKNPLNFLSFGFMILCIIMVQIQHRNKDLGGYMTYGRAIGAAAICLAVAGLLDGFYTFIFYTAFHPEAMITSVHVQMEQMESTGFFSAEELDKMYENSMSTAKPIYVAIGKFFSVVFIGIIISLITAIFTRKKNPEEIF